MDSNQSQNPKLVLHVINSYKQIEKEYEDFKEVIKIEETGWQGLGFIVNIAWWNQYKEYGEMLNDLFENKSMDERRYETDQEFRTQVLSSISRMRPPPIDNRGRLFTYVPGIEI